MERNCVLLDTSFLIRLLNAKEDLHANALGYYKYCLENEFILKTSTISIAEYCVRGNIDELPLRGVQIVPFNINHAECAGKLAAIVFQNREILDLLDRKIIPNDTKLFAQADTEAQIQYFATFDAQCIKIFNLLKKETKLRFDIMNTRNPFNETFGILDLK